MSTIKFRKSPYIGIDGGVDEYHVNPTKKLINRKQSAINIHIDDNRLFKRPGRVLWGPEFESVFNGAQEYIDPDGTSHLLVVNNGYVYDVNALTRTVIDSGLSNEEIHLHNFRGKCFYNGINTQRKINVTTASDVGIDAPNDAPIVSASDGSGLIGSYAWVYTYVIKEDGVKIYESDPSPVSESLVLDNENVIITPSVSGDSRVNARRIYRTEAGGAKYWYEGEIDNNTNGSTYTSGSIDDSSLGDMVEINHGKPVQGSISEGCNERLFWIVGSYLYWSEMAEDDSYIEYQKTLNFAKLPNNGKGVGLKRLYNNTTGREDLYIFQEDSVCVLPSGDPNQAILTVVNYIGCKQHDTIVEYNGSIVFLTNNEKIGIITNGRFIDISSRSIPTSISKIINQQYCRGALIFGNYYVITGRNNLGKLYNNQSWVCDLRTIKEVKNGVADAVWYLWDVNIEYWLQLEDGKVLGFDNNSRRIYHYSLDYSNDQNADGTNSNITSRFRTIGFFGDDLFSLKKAHVLHIDGNSEKSFTITPFSWKNTSSSIVTFTPIESAFVAGVSVMGSATTKVLKQIKKPLPSNCVGNQISFEFTSSADDVLFELYGFQFTYSVFGKAF